MLESQDGKLVKELLGAVVRHSAEAPEVLAEFEVKKSKVSILEFVRVLQQTLEIPQEMLILAIVLLRRIGSRQVRVTHKLLYKYYPI